MCSLHYKQRHVELLLGYGQLPKECVYRRMHACQKLVACKTVVVALALPSYLLLRNLHKAHSTHVVVRANMLYNTQL